MSSLVRDGIEVLLVVAVGGMLWSVIDRLRHRQLRVVRCARCRRPASRAYPSCPRCGAPVS